MRFKLILELNRSVYGNIMPIDYQYAMSGVIYRILSRGNEEYASWLHNNGYKLDNGKSFKHFCYSPLKIEKRYHPNESDRLYINSDTVEWQISFLPEKSTEEFIKGIFLNQIFEIADYKSKVQFTIRHIEAMPEPLFSEKMTYITMSPICTRFKMEDNTVSYLDPNDIRAKKLLIDGLRDKFSSLYGEATIVNLEQSDFSLLNKPESRLISIKSRTEYFTRVKGYKCQFQLAVPIELQKIAYHSGLGSQCSQGFGCLRVIEK